MLPHMVVSGMPPLVHSYWRPTILGVYSILSHSSDSIASGAFLSCLLQDFHSGKTALHMAVERDSLADVCLLVESCEVDVNAQTFSGCTPLHIASGRGNIAIVAYLLSVGTDPDILSDEGDTALDLAGSEQVCTDYPVCWLH